MLLFSLIPATYVIWGIRDSNLEVEGVAHVGDPIVDKNGKEARAGDEGVEKDEEIL